MFHVSVYHGGRKHAHTVYRFEVYDNAVRLLHSVMYADGISKVEIVRHTPRGTEHMYTWEPTADLVPA